MIPVIDTTYRILKESLLVLFGRSAGSDIIRYRDLMFRLIKLTEDKRGYFQIE